MIGSGYQGDPLESKDSGTDKGRQRECRNAVASSTSSDGARGLAATRAGADGNGRRTAGTGLGRRGGVVSAVVVATATLDWQGGLGLGDGDSGEPGGSGLLSAGGRAVGARADGVATVAAVVAAVATVVSAVRTAVRTAVATVAASVGAVAGAVAADADFLGATSRASRLGASGDAGLRDRADSGGDSNLLSDNDSAVGGAVGNGGSTGGNGANSCRINSRSSHIWAGASGRGASSTISIGRGRGRDGGRVGRSGRRDRGRRGNRAAGASGSSGRGRGGSSG